MFSALNAIKLKVQIVPNASNKHHATVIIQPEPNAPSKDTALALDTIALFFDNIIEFIMKFNMRLLLMHASDFDPSQSVFYLKYISRRFDVIQQQLVNNTTTYTINRFDARTINLMGFAQLSNGIYFHFPFFVKSPNHEHDQRALVALFLLRKLAVFAPPKRIYVGKKLDVRKMLR